MTDREDSKTGDTTGKGESWKCVVQLKDNGARWTTPVLKKRKTKGSALERARLATYLVAGASHLHVSVYSDGVEQQAWHEGQH